MNVALLAIGSLALVGGIIYVTFISKKVRAEQFQKLADEMSLQFYPQGDGTVQNEIGHLRLFNQGHSPNLQDMISGQTEDIEVALFDYQYATGGGEDRKTHHQTVITFQSPHLSLPAFEIRPKGILNKIGQALGYHDIAVDSHPTFSKRYLLRGPEETAVRDFLTPNMLKFFGSRKGISVEASGNRLLYYRAGKGMKPKEARSFMVEGFHVYELLTQDQAD